MTNRLFRPVAVVILSLAFVSPAAAANKEHQQLMADIRMLQEQAQLLQNLLGTLNDWSSRIIDHGWFPPDPYKRASG